MSYQNVSTTNIVWLDLNSSYSHSSMALCTIESNTPKTDDICWEKVSATLSGSISEIVVSIIDKKPDILAATTWLFNHDMLIKICERVKKLLPETIIILGGPEFNGDNESFLRKNMFIDLVFRGEGDLEFVNFIKVWRYKELWHSVRGLCFMDGESYHNGIYVKVEDITKLNSPFKSRFFDSSKPFVQLETQRGCFNNCAFCVSGNDKPIRSLNIEIIRERILEVAKSGIKDIRVLDRTFNYNSKRAIELLNLFYEFGDMNFHLEVHPSLLTDGVKQMLAMAPKGVLHIEAGVQSLKDEVLRASGRRGDSCDTIKGVKFLAECSNFETHTDLIAGLPFYSLDDIYDDINTLASLNCAEVQLELLKLLPGTLMRNESDKYGIKYAETPPYEVLQSNRITNSELFEASLLSKVIDWYYNSEVWHCVTQKLISDNSSFLKEFYNFMRNKSMLSQPLSLSTRGELLFFFCKENYIQYCDQITLTWITNGMSMKNDVAQDVESIKTVDRSQIETIEGNITESMKFYKFKNYIMGFDRAISHSHSNFIGYLKSCEK